MAVKATKAQELVYENVAAKLDAVFGKEGFKYQKSKKRFLRQSGKLDHVISLYPERPAIYYDDDANQVFVCFQLSGIVEMPAFDKWYNSLSDQPNRFMHRVKNGWLRLRMNVSFDEFTGDDFYTPTNSQRFKGLVSSTLAAGKLTESESMDLEAAYSGPIPDLLKGFDISTDILKIFEDREYPHSLPYLLFLHYNGFTADAKEHIEKSYQFQLNLVKEKLQQNADDDVKSYLHYLASFIDIIRKAGIAEYPNPFEATVKPVEYRQSLLAFAPGLSFKEKLRLDIEQLDIQQHEINNKGEILLLHSYKHVLKLSPDGSSILVDFIIESPKGFGRLDWAKTGQLKGTHDFFVNNYIIREDNTVLELQLPLNTIKKSKHPQNFHVQNLVYSVTKEKYYLLYEDLFLTYNKSGEKESAVTVNRTSNGGIYPEKEWLILQYGKSGYGLFNFDGSLISEHEVSGGNHDFALSTGYDYLAFFFYSTKSQLYNLSNGKKHTLWAHPTLVKGYVETMYNDINHNFGMTHAAFSPDGTYLVGGADHGKYVAWNLPKVERVELIPDPAFIQLLQPETNRIFLNMDGTVAPHEEVRPGIVELEGQRFFVNRGNDITKIIFIDNGTFFLTELGNANYVLTWDRQFNNLGYLKAEGRLNQHGTFLSVKNKKELIMYHRE